MESRQEIFEREFTPHIRSMIVVWCVKRMGDRHDGEELAQEVLLRAWKTFDRFTPGTNFRAWIIQIALYTLYNHSRVRTARRRFMIHTERPVERSARQEPPREHAEILDTVLRHTWQAELFCDVYVRELSYTEAARKHRIPVGTVMSRLSRVRRILADSPALSALASELDLRRGKSRSGGRGNFKSRQRGPELEVVA